MSDLSQPPPACAPQDAAAQAARNWAAPADPHAVDTGDPLRDCRVTSIAELERALARPVQPPVMRIGQALMALGCIDEHQLGDALALQTRERHLPLGQLLLQRGAVTRRQLQLALACKMGYPVVDAAAFPLEAEATALLGAQLARRWDALALMVRGDRLVVALEDPSARMAIDELERHTALTVVPVLALAGTLAPALQRAVGPLQDGVPAAPHADPGAAPAAPARTGPAAACARGVGAAATSAAALAADVRALIAQARAAGASVIHVHCPAGDTDVSIRLRRDGALRHHAHWPARQREPLLGQLKAMAGLDLGAHGRAQRGTFGLDRIDAGQALQVQVLILPTAGDREDVVLRLPPPAAARTLEQLDLSGDTRARLGAVLERRGGLVLCAGPADSGRRTALHAALAHLATPQRAVWTVEQPAGPAPLRQVRLDAAAGWTRLQALRMLRDADADVAMIGALDAPAPARAAVAIARAGSLVLGTLHAGDAIAGVERLLELGLDRAALGDTLHAVLAQRLARRLCRHCVYARPADPQRVRTWLQAWQCAARRAGGREADAAVLARWQLEYGRQGHLLHHEAPGCAQCEYTGLDGRIALHDLLVVDDGLRHLIRSGAAPDALRRRARAQGRRTLERDGIEKVLAGWTTLEEVLAACNG